jgi:hypothetical protein
MTTTKTKKKDPCGGFFLFLRQTDRAVRDVSMVQGHGLQGKALCFPAFICADMADVAIYEFKGNKKEGSNIEGEGKERERERESVCVRACDYPSFCLHLNVRQGLHHAYTDDLQGQAKGVMR